jgi:hypothetical protein
MVAFVGSGVWRYVHPDVVNSTTEDLRSELVRLGMSIESRVFPLNWVDGCRQGAVSQELSRRYMEIEYPAMVARDTEDSNERPTVTTATTDLNALSR